MRLAVLNFGKKSQLDAILRRFSRVGTGRAPRRKKMKKLLLLIIPFFLCTTQANAFIAVGVAKWAATKAYKQLPPKERERIKKDLAKRFATPKPQAAKGK